MSFHTLYANELFKSTLANVTTDASPTAGYGVLRAVDGSYHTKMKVSGHSGDFYIQIDRSDTNYSYSDNLAFAVLNHNLYSNGCTSISLQASTSSGSGYIEWASPTLDDDNDILCLTDTQLANKRYWRVVFEFGSGEPTGDVEVGQIMLGIYQELTDTPALPINIGWRFRTAMLETEAGGRITSSRDRREERMGLNWQGLDSTERGYHRTLAGSWKGAAHIFPIVTHKHTWATSGLGSGINGQGDCWCCQLETDGYSEVESDQNPYYDVAWSVIRYMKDDATT